MLFDIEEFGRWLRQAEYTLESAEDDLKAKKFSWSCFKSQQAAEYAVKGLLYGLGVLATGHSVTRLMGALEERGLSVEGVMSDARSLDRHYVPARYPNAHPEGAPFEYYDEETAREALHSAELIIEVVREASEKWV